MAKLIHEAGLFVSPLEENYVIGRGHGVDISVIDRCVSRKHATFHIHKGRWYVEDLNSTNGTFINEKRIIVAPLTDGDELIIGTVKFHFYEKD